MDVYNPTKFDDDGPMGSEDIRPFRGQNFYSNCVVKIENSQFQLQGSSGAETRFK